MARRTIARLQPTSCSRRGKKRTVRQILVDPTDRSALYAEFRFESGEQFLMTDSVKCGRDVQTDQRYRRAGVDECLWERKDATG